MLIRSHSLEVIANNTHALTCSDDTTLRMWDIERVRSAYEPTAINTPPGHSLAAVRRTRQLREPLQHESDRRDLVVQSRQDSATLAPRTGHGTVALRASRRRAHRAVLARTTVPLLECTRHVHGTVGHAHAQMSSTLHDTRPRAQSRAWYVVH